MKKFYFAIILSCLIFVGCKPEAEAPTVVTQDVEEVMTNAAKVVYNVVYIQKNNLSAPKQKAL